MRPTKQQLFIPFSGFYCSIHDDAIDREIDSIFSDYATGMSPNKPLLDAALEKTDFSSVRENYAKKYAEIFAHKIGSDGLTFYSLISPKYYNFQTDRILCNVTQSELKNIVRNTAPDILAKICTERHTSRSGFISFYDPDYKTWGPIEKWDSVQLESLFLAYLETVEIDAEQIEYEILECVTCNGHLSNWLYDVIPERLLKIHDYIETRNQRKAAQ